jgi:2-keto-3-deoxy-L-rhamnonate aldolase RhmA
MSDFYPSNFRKKMATGKAVLGTSMPAPMTHIAAQTYSTGCDWSWIDLEHSPWGLETAYPVLLQGRMSDVAPILRVPWNEPGIIKRAYDAGTVGVMVPQIDNPEEAAEAISYAKYPPLGARGIAPFFAGFLGISAHDVVVNANDETVLALQMESAEAWEKIDETLALDGFELLILGPADLSASYGGQGDVHFSKVEHIMVDLAAKVKRSNKALGSTFADPEDARRWIREGYTVMNVSSPMLLGIDGLKRIFAELRDEFGQPGV